MKLRDLAFWGSVGLIVAAFIAWQWAPAHEFAWKFDEGIDAMKARLLLDGHSLYNDIWSDQPPLFTLFLAAAFSLFGQSVFVGRTLVLALSALGLLSIGYIGRRVGGHLAGLLVVLLLALLPHFQELSRVILIGLPAIAVALMALAAGFAYQSSGKLRWLTLAGLLLSTSLLIKPLTPPCYLPLSALALLGSHQQDGGSRERIRRWVGFSAIVGILLLLAVVLFDPRAFLSQVVGTYCKMREARGVLLFDNISTVGNYLLHNEWGGGYYGVAGLATVGLLGLAMQRRWNHLLPMGLWLVAVFLAVLFHSPLRDHELFLLMPPLVVAAGIGTEQAVTGVRAFRRAGAAQRILAVAAVAFLILTAYGAPRMVVQDCQQRAHSLETQRNREDLARSGALEFLQWHVPADGVIITGDPMLAFKAGLSVPPALAVISHRRIEAGKLPASLLIDLSTRLHPSAIIFWTGRLDSVTEYADWVPSNGYCACRTYYGGRRIYLPCRPIDARFASQFELTGWNIDPPVVAPSDSFTLILSWRALAETEADYHVFVHAGADEPVAQSDGVPKRGEHPTYRWQVGEEVPDPHMLTIRADAEPGVFPLWVGMYDRGTRIRLPVTDAQGNPAGDSLLLGSVRVGEPDYEPPSRTHPRNVTIGDSIRFRGYDLPSAEARPGETIDVTLYWECLTPLETSYTVFVHLLGPDGKIYGQQDSVPWGGRLPTTHWVAGEVITDEYAVPVSQDDPAGTYTLAVGMYDLQTGIRLAASDADGTPLANNSVPIGQVTVNE